MSPRMFNTLKFFGAVLSFVIFGICSYHIFWLYTVIPTFDLFLGVVSTMWMIVVIYYWTANLWEYVNPNSKWWRRMRSKDLEEFKAQDGEQSENQDAVSTKVMEKKKEIETKFADIRIINKSETILGYFNGSPIHESITVMTGGREIVLPYNASYTSMEEIPTNTKTDRLLVVIGNFITYGMDV